MGVTYKHTKRYENFFGTDLKSNALEFPEKYAASVSNVQIAPTGVLQKRVGYQPHADSVCSHGLFTYNRVHPLTGEEDQQILGVSTTLKKLSKATLTVTYTGTDPTARLSIFLDTATDQYRCQIEVGTVTVLDSPLGLGRDELAPKTMTTLRAEIDALTDITATLSGDGSTPAAFMECVSQYDLTSGAYQATGRYWSALNECPQSGNPNLLGGSETHKNDLSYENATAVVLQNCLYVSNGYDEVLKYDGQNLYRAGLPTPTRAAVAGTSASGRVYVWRTQYVQTDAVFNVAESNIASSLEYSYTDPSAATASVTVYSVQAGSGFNTNCALISGTGTGTAIPVTAGHTMKAGDTAYLWNTVTSAYETRSVVSVGATTVTVNSSIGYTNSVTNNRNVISNNLRIRIFRNVNSGITPTLFFEVVDIPNNSFVSSQTYSDTTSDANLISNIQLVEPATDRSPPAKGRYISAFQTLLVTAGDFLDPNVVSFSDIENCEYFPIPDNQFPVANLQGDVISGIHPSNENFLIFQSRAIHAVTGDVPNGSFRVDTITTDIGCAAHATIRDVRGSVCFLSLVGPREMSAASVPRGLGQYKDNAYNSRIDPMFSQRGVSAEELYRLKRAIAINDRKGERYIVYIPCESVLSGTRYSNSNSRVLAYDYTRDSWLFWDNLDATGGLITCNSDNDIYLIERRLSGLTVKNYLHRFLTTGTYLDYQDHDQAITFKYVSPWEFLGEAGVRKNFQNILVYSAEDLDRPFTVQIQTESNFVAETPISNCSITFGAGGYGTSAYGDDPYGDPSTTGLKHKLNNGRVTSLRVIFSNAEEQTNISITGYELEVAAPYKPAYKT